MTVVPESSVLSGACRINVRVWSRGGGVLGFFSAVLLSSNTSTRQMGHVLVFSSQGMIHSWQKKWPHGSSVQYVSQSMHSWQMAPKEVPLATCQPLSLLSLQPH